MSSELTSGGRAVGIVPTTFDDVQRVAKALVAAGMGSFGYGDNSEQKVAKATAQIMTGLELGVPPMQAMSNIAVINGKPQVWGELVPALLHAHNFEFDMWIEGEGDERIAFAWLKRPSGKEYTQKYSVAQAKESGLWDTRETVKRKDKQGKWYDAKNDAPWFRYKPDMLQWKAVARLVKRGAADVMKGVALREDMDSSNVVDITPNVTVAADPIPFDEIDQTGPDDELPIRDIADEVSDADNEWPQEQQATYIASIAENLAAADSVAVITEIADGNAEQVERFSPSNKATIAQMYANRHSELLGMEAAE